MNDNQKAFSDFWEQIAGSVFYKVITITEQSDFIDKVLDKQRIELSECIKNEINKKFFDYKLRPDATVWLEDLQKSFPDVATKFTKSLKECEIASKSYESIIAIAAGGTVALTGAAIGKKSPLLSTLLILGGVGVAGYKIASGLTIDTQLLQNEVKKQFSLWKESLLKILERCGDDTSFALNQDE